MLDEHKQALLDSMDARIERLEATHKITSVLGCKLDQVALDLAACKQLRRRCIRNWNKRAVTRPPPPLRLRSPQRRPRRSSRH
jgi:hypothetical protein